MNSLLRGLLDDFIQAAKDESVPPHELGTLAQEVDSAVSTEFEHAGEAIAAVSELLHLDGPPLYIVSVMLGGWVERGAPPQGAAPLVRRMQQWLPKAVQGESSSLEALSETWRALVAILGAWPQERLRAAEDVGAFAERLASSHPAGVWLTRLFAAPHKQSVQVILPERAEPIEAELTGVADILQLSVLVNAAFETVPEAAAKCARGEGPQQVPGATVRLPRVLTELDGEVLPQGADLSVLPQHEGRTLVVALSNPEPYERPVGRAFSTLKASLRLLDAEAG